MRYLDRPNNQCFVFPPPKHFVEDSVVVVGKQTVRGGESYPLEGFPSTALFSDSGGRCINYYQLVFVVEGQGIFKDRGLTYNVIPGSMILIKPGVWHSYAPLEETGWTEYYVGFSGSVFAKVVRDGFPQGGGIRYLRVKEKIVAIFEKMIGYARNEPDDVGFLLTSILMLLISETVFSGNDSFLDNDHSVAILSKARDYMEEKVSQKINLCQLAGNLGVSYTTFKNIFKDLTGESPIDYLKQLRIRKSKFLLGTTDKSVKAIGVECGFGSSEYFCNCFRHETGFTPLGFREQYKLESSTNRGEIFEPGV